LPIIIPAQLGRYEKDKEVGYIHPEGFAIWTKLACLEMISKLELLFCKARFLDNDKKQLFKPNITDGAD
jgi:hypothetical protein